jgi:hypothetical protein
LLCQSLAAQTIQTQVPADQKLAPLYSDAVKHHLAIKTFLASKESKDPRAEPLLVFLLRSGFSIDDFPRAYAVINMPIGPTESAYIEALRKDGRTEEKIQLTVERRRSYYRALGRNLIKQMTGITDNTFVDFMQELRDRHKPADFKQSVIFTVAEDKEKLLTDTDWLTDAYLRAISSYSGERRHFAVMPIQLSPEDNSLNGLRSPR